VLPGKSLHCGAPMPQTAGASGYPTSAIVMAVLMKAPLLQERQMRSPDHWLSKGFLHARHARVFTVLACSSLKFSWWAFMRVVDA
jgi:hypothetical protein